MTPFSSNRIEEIDSIKKKRNTIVWISIGFFVFSLTQKCYYTTNNCSDSIMVFLLGWFAVFSGGAGIAWLANPFLILSWMATKRNSKHALWFCLLALCFSLSFLLFDTITDSESGHQNQIINYKMGYWFWVASAAILVTGNIFLRLKTHQTKNNL